MPLLLLVALACSGKDQHSDSPEPVPTEGTLAFTFRIDTDWMDAMEEPPVGSFWGDIFLSSQVTGAGPDEGAEVLGSIYVELVDLTPDGGPSEVLFTSEALPVGEVTVLGFLDSDANSTEDDRGPDDKDPVTLPNDNEFDVVGGEETVAEIFFGLLNP